MAALQRLEGELPPPQDLSHHFSKITKRRTPSSIKEFYRFFAIPNIGNLGGGLPNDELFPFDTLEAQTANPDRYQCTPNHPVSARQDHRPMPTHPSRTAGKKAPPPESDINATSWRIKVPKSTPQADPVKRVDLSTALQYGTAGGYPPLLSLLRQFSCELLHPSVPYRGGPEVIITCGSTDGFSKTVQLVSDAWDPDHEPVEARPGMLCERYVYNNALACVEPRGVQVVPIDTDADGMLAAGPGGLEEVLANWDPRRGRRPHFMYSVTMGHNPTGTVIPVSRRREIYAICQRFDVIIVEDDPYWYLQFASAPEREAESRGHAAKPAVPYTPAKSTGYDFLDSLVPSYLSMDVDGRVIRLDTFSKTVAPGCRLGWITTQPAFIERLERITETTTQQPSGFVQAMVVEMLMGPTQKHKIQSFQQLSAADKACYRGWELDGWVRWLEGLRGVYERRMLRMCSLLDESLFQLKQSTPVSALESDWGVITKTRITSYDWPRGGMFVWVRVHLENHPLWQASGISVPVLDGPALAQALMIFLTHKPQLVIAAPGTMFAATPKVAEETAWAYLRLCFGTETEDNIEPCSRRFAAGLQRFWRIKSVREMERLVAELRSSSASESEFEDLANLGFDGDDE
ncbi:aromatic amino acid aminotransferase 1 [Cordyceps fumosorosea ARSEF 2679]|uniref:Aromatic amino acid aminotransferase 1 n=1 Tax=Cordyceps fumosorosea (strain ARSEF 2679) TaxID=1081104 RepID=A0A162JXA9_CORFA|nr:aromatic amino acid aminotransferase 1 [Cordyceps fumosorosea ARSEF 2679]OAA54223.1 aromatic amino acid aminotransferase 1 [Cordyceps fumosorosea ARSEF 2679]